MKVFVTGASGLVGSACIPQLIAAGHQVFALVRSDASAEKVEKAGAIPVKGSAEDLEVLKKTASESDAVMHLAFDHDLAFSGKMDLACEKDRAAIKALGDGLVQTSTPDNKKVFIYAFGFLDLVGADEYASEYKSGSDRHRSSQAVAAYAEQGLRAVVVRLAPVVHSGDRIHPFISSQIGYAKKHGHAVYVNDGKHVWGTCNITDAADLFVRALDKGLDSCNLHAAAEKVPVIDIANVISKKLNVPTKSISAEQARQEMGFMGWIWGTGTDVTWNLTQEWTGWQPKHSGLIERMETDYTY